MGATRPLLSWLAAAMVAFAALPASAQTTWTGTSGTSWNTAGNWSNGVPSASGTAVFAGTTSTQPTDTAGSLNIGLVQFNSGAGAYTLGNFGNSGQFFFTDGGGITVNAGVTTNQKIWTWIRPAATSGTSTVAITNNGTGLLDLNTFMTSFNPGTNSLGILSVGGSGTTQFAQVLERTSSNVTSVVKNGSGTLIILASAAGASGATTAGYFSGSTTINGGTLQLGDSTALGSGTGSIVFGGGTLRYSGSNTVDYSSRIRSGTSAISIDTAGQSVTFSSALAASNTGGLAKSGAGTLTLSAANAYTGTTSITAGVLNIQNASALGGTAAGTIVSNSAALQIQGGITVTGESLSLIGGGISNDGALRNISGTNTWTGAIAADGVGTAQANGDLSPHNRVASDAGLLTLSGPIQIAAPAASGSAAGMLVQGNGNVVISGNISGGKAGNSSFVSSANGTGTRTLSGSNSYLGWTVVNGNTTVEGGLAIPDASRVIMTSTTGRLVLNASETIGGLASSAASQINLNSHTLTIGADNTTPLASDSGGATYLGTIIGTGGIVKVGTGVLTLSASNSYSGGTVVKGGILALGLDGSFANSPTITIGDAGSSGAVLDISAKTGTFTFSGSQTVGGIGTLKMDAADTARFAGTFAPGNSPGIFTFDGGTALLSGTTQIEILGGARGTGYDAIDLLNAATLNYGNGVLALDFGSWLADQQSYQLFGSGSSSLLGSFSSVTIAGTNYAGLTFSGSNGVWTSQGSSPANQTLTFTEATGTLVIVPEPGAIALAGIGIAAAAYALRSRSPSRKRAG